MEAPSSISKHSARDSSVTEVISSGRIDCRMNALGRTGLGCVGW